MNWKLIKIGFSGQVGYEWVRMEGEMPIACKMVHGALAAAGGFVCAYSLAPKPWSLSSQAEEAEETFRLLEAAAMQIQKEAPINRERALKSLEEAAVALKEAEQGASV